MHRYALTGLLSTGLLLLGGILGYGSVVLASNSAVGVPTPAYASVVGQSWDFVPGGCWDDGLRHQGWRGTASNASQSPSSPDPASPVDWIQEASFQRDIQPIFEARCVACHGGTEGLYLNSYENVMAGGRHGAVIVPDNPDASRLIRYVQSGYMPYGGLPLTAAQIDLLITWVAAGAPNN